MFGGNYERICDVVEMVDDSASGRPSDYRIFSCEIRRIFLGVAERDGRSVSAIDPKQRPVAAGDSEFFHEKLVNSHVDERASCRILPYHPTLIYGGGKVLNLRNHFFDLSCSLTSFLRKLVVYFFDLRHLLNFFHS